MKHKIVYQDIQNTNSFDPHTSTTEAGSIVMPILLLGLWRLRTPKNEVTYLRTHSVGDRAGILKYMLLTAMLYYRL